jgi:putative tricarboxylic transport membrane protein
MNDRLFSLLLLLSALFYGMTALDIKVPFAYDPLGPKPVPITLAVLLVVLAIILLLRPLKDKFAENLLGKRVLHLIAIILFYQISWSIFGFLMATTISVYMLSRLFQCSWMQGLLTALLISVTCYGLFNFILKIPLPLGTLFSYGSG